MDNKNIWSTSDILANRNNWSLAADVELLKHLQALSEKIFTKAASTLHLLNSFENDVNQTCISIANASNKFKALSDTKFIESRVQEESSDINEPLSLHNEPPADYGDEHIAIKLKEALENGFQVLDTQYDIISVTGSDSEDEEPQEILLRARNPYLNRRLPHIIGSEEFTRNDNLGLIDSSSEEDEEEADEEDYDTDDEEDRKEVHVNSEEDNITVQKPPSFKTEFVRPRTEILRISSSDSEDSDSSIPFEEQEKIISENENTLPEKSKVNELVHNSNSFAENLSAALKNNLRNIYNSVPPDFRDTPPPFPGEDNGLSSDEGSEDSNDIFYTKKSTKHSISNTNYNSNYDNESDGDDDNRCAEETVVIFQERGVPEKTTESRKASIASKTSLHSDLGNSSSDVNEAPLAPLSKPKFTESNVNSINKRMALAINAELNTKLNLKSPSVKPTENLNSAQTASGSSEIHTTVENFAKPWENEKAAKNNTLKTTNEQVSSIDVKKDSKKSGLFGKLANEIDNENGNEDDLFSGIASKKSSSKSTKNKRLFDDDDNIDELFSPVKSAQSSTKKTTELFSSKSSVSTKPEKLLNESTIQPPVVDLFKNSNLFASDSDSEDDIFSIIKNQKKPAAEIFITKSSDSKQTSIPSNDTLINKSLSLHKEEKSPSRDIKTSPKTNSAKRNETTVSVDIASTSKKDLFETTNEKKTTEELFESYDSKNDFFARNNKSADNQTSTNENVNLSKSEIYSSTNIGENIIEEKSVRKILKNIRLSSSSESVCTGKNFASQEVENIVETDKVNIFAKFLPPKLSSSSEDEDVKQEYISDVSHTSRNDENEKTDATLSYKKDKLFDLSSRQSSEDISNAVSSQKYDIIGESYESTSAMYLPPKDNLSDDVFEDEDIKDSNYLSQEDEDLENKLGPPPFQEANFDEVMFNVRRSTNNLQEALKRSIETEVTVDDSFKTDSMSIEDLFAKSSNSLSLDKKLSGKTFLENLNLNIDSVNQSRDEEINKNDTIQKLLFSNEKKINFNADELFDETKDSGLFKFAEKVLYSSESHIPGVISVKNANCIPVVDNVTGLKKNEQIKFFDKACTSDDYENSTEKCVEHSQGNTTIEKLSTNSKFGKINTGSFEKLNAEKKQTEDIQDGNLFVKTARSELTRPAPGKLAMGRGLNINVNALLPGGNKSSKMKQNSEQITPDEKQIDESEPFIIKESHNNEEQLTGLLNNVGKERPRVSGKRRPPSRQARKNRILNHDVFSDGFGKESSQEEKSSVSNGSPKVLEKVEVEKSERSEKKIDGIVDDSEDKINDLFGISESKTSSTIQQSDTISNSLISNVTSFCETNDSDLDFDITFSSYAKPQKGSPDISLVISDEKINSAEPELKYFAERSELSVDKISNPSTSFQSISPSIKTPAAKSIFDSLEDDDDDLFEIIKSKKNIEEKPTKENIEETPSKKIIEENPSIKPEVKLETKSASKLIQQQTSSKHTTAKSAKIDIFNDDDDDDELFTSAKNKLPANKLSKRSSLFEDNNDDDLFGSKRSTLNRKTTDPVAPSAKTKILNEKPRIVKLRSETVEKDPLTGKDITGPL